MSSVRIGCSGFNYAHWKGTFYPDGLAQRRWFEHYCNVFDSVELNVTFYRLPLRKTYEKWYSETPDGFGFALKGSRFITHIKRLREPGEPLGRFFEGALHLKDKLKVVLWQLPPSLRIDLELLGGFLESLRPYGVQNAFEFRNETWKNGDVTSIMERHGAAFCMADWPRFLNDLPVTAHFVYIRRHGREGNFATCYSNEELQHDAEQIRSYSGTGKRVFVFFNNDAHGYAPQNARQLREMLT